LLKLLEQPEIISFAGGIPDTALFPKEAVATAYADVLAGKRNDFRLLQQLQQFTYFRRLHAHRARGEDIFPIHAIFPHDLIIPAGQHELPIMSTLLT
jgi:DNA-binding transcriptional MocR family regulator